ncbi:MAG: sugar ABC transporter [Micrococcales bacterium]|nr:MAG: sugar ABC transporter [Micrococcales bacterium]
MSATAAEGATPHPAEDRLARLRTEPMVLVGGTSGVLAGTARSLRDVWGYRELLGLLVKRELKVRYKDSALGLVWTMLRPLALLTVYYVAIGKFLGAQRAIPDFAIYVFTGLAIWGLFTEVVTAGTNSIITNAGLVKKVSLPREVFPLSVLGSSLVNYAIQLGILVVATAVLGAFPLGFRWVYFPLATVVVVVWSLALALVLSAWNVYLRDVQYLVEVVLMVGFWATPTLYSWALVRQQLENLPWLQELYLANPVTLAVLGMQQTFWVAGTGQPIPDHLATRLLLATLVGLVGLFVAQRVFARLSGSMAQEL